MNCNQADLSGDAGIAGVTLAAWSDRGRLDLEMAPRRRAIPAMRVSVEGSIGGHLGALAVQVPRS